MLSGFKKVFCLALLFVNISAFASHIVGGEFELVYLRKNFYRLSLIYYYDEKNSSFPSGPGFEEPFITVAIFRKHDNMLMRQVVLEYKSIEDVKYTLEKCSSDIIVTDKVIYGIDEIEMSDAEYGHPDGYYVVWERCCRNYQITNIYSEDPMGNANAANAAGQTFFLEFPPVVKDGKPFINSSPRLFPPLSDYGCAFMPYYANFAGTDPDDDSLVYSIVTPLNTHSVAAVPPITQATLPFPEIKWRAGFGLTNVMQGSPDLHISRDGILRVTPTLNGLFVFAVKCEEYRNGVKIGEVRRDFQMFVADGCEPSAPPEITAKDPDTGVFDTDLSVSFENTVTDSDRCIEIKVTDPDIFSPAHNFSEEVSIRAIAIGFKADIEEILPASVDASLSQANPDKVFKVCFDRCPYNATGRFKIGIIAMDDACALPLLDTAFLDIYVEPPFNTDPYFQTTDVDESLPVNSTKSWDIIGKDDDLDPLEIKVLTDGFTLGDYGMALQTTLLENGKYVAQLAWNPDCDVQNFAARQDFNLKIVMNDVECNFNTPDTMIFDLDVVIPENTAPVLTAESGSAVKLEDNTMAAEVDEPIILNLFSKDVDTIIPHNFITLELDPERSILPENYTFKAVTGYNDIATSLSWSPDCSIFEEGTTERKYKFVFRTYDRSCIERKFDSLTIDATITDIDPRREAFSPPNVITPNGDGLNEFFGLDDIVKTSPGDVLPNLPLDNCRTHFISIEIFNRWGKKIFESEQRNFRWFANNESPGVYFYTLRYTDIEYKGTITVKF